jgi:hypothetical protein
MTGRKNVVILCGSEILNILWVYVTKLYKARIARTTKEFVTGQTTGIFLTQVTERSDLLLSSLVLRYIIYL